MSRLEHTLPRLLIADICEQLGYDIRDVSRIVITPWQVEVTELYPITASDERPIDPWADSIKPDPWKRGDDDTPDEPPFS